MLETIKKEWSAKVALIFFLFFVVWWIEANSFKVTNSEAQLKIFTSVYGILALGGAFWGIVISRKWGGFASVMGRSLIMFSLGLFAQEFGQVAYSYYYYGLHIEVPYPSIGDIGYFGSIPLYIYGTILLAKASGVHVSLKSVEKRIQAVVIPLIMLIIAYWLFLRGYEFDWSHPMTIFLDFGYPFGQAIYISIAFLTFLLSRGLLGGVMRYPILWILFSLLVQFIADYSFLYLTANKLWIAGGINDLVYVIAYFLMTLSLIQFKNVLIRLRSIG